MNITEAVNAILKRYPSYGYDVFIDLNKIKDDDLQEAVQFIAGMRRSCRAEPKRVRKVNRETFKAMVEEGYVYKEIAMATGLAESTVGTKIRAYGLSGLYHQMHFDIKNEWVPVICLNVETGERKIFKSILATERAFGFKKNYLKYKIKGNRRYIENGWEFRRGD